MKSGLDSVWCLRDSADNIEASGASDQLGLDPAGLREVADEIELLRKIIIRGCDERPEPPIGLTEGEWMMVRELRRQEAKRRS